MNAHVANLPTARVEALPPTGSVHRAPSSYVRGGRPRVSWLARSALAGLGAAAAAGVVVLALRAGTQRDGAGGRAVRRLFRSAAMLSFSVLADSGLEHYRARFKNRAMFIAPAVAGLSLTASFLGGSRRFSGVGRLVFASAAVTGAVGAGLHSYNVGKREGGFGWTNLFYGAPLGAPAALGLAGALGLAAHAIRDGTGGHTRLLGMRAGPAVSIGSAGALLGLAAEVGLLHFRGAFQNPFMYVPVVLPPAAAAALGAAGVAPRPQLVQASRALLTATAAAGFAGAGFHAYGIARNMGGWSNWSQMLLQGPPLPAPPSLTGIAIAGLGGLDLLETRRG